MRRNDDVGFTSSSLKIPLAPRPSPFNFPFCYQALASRIENTRNSLARLIDSVKGRSDFRQFSPRLSHLWNRSNESTLSASGMRSGCSASQLKNVGGGGGLLIGKSFLLCSASLSLIRPDNSTQAGSSGTQQSCSTSQRGREEVSVSLIPKSSLLCSASLALARAEDLTTQASDLSGRETQQKGHSASRVHDEERVLISEVLVRDKDGEELERKDLETEALQALKASRANSALTVSEVQEDVHRIIQSGYFSSCMPVAVDTRDGIRLVFQVEPNQEFQGLVCEGANVLPAKFLEDSLRDGYGKVINLRRLDEAISSINGWYIERGFFALVSDVEMLSGGILRLQVSEAEVNNISIRFLDRKTGEPTTGKTKPETILRQLQVLICIALSSFCKQSYLD
ncbi:Outer envelope protein 80, chloroplastic [Morella rubra]|uniref:Outer envelope protein 80, chloroplastic n=1 Tax=Morella rubra TaxID=262757 RepID=A0A6A1V007_9ROSI|nr:Outer envelope protein 80, chloroplastic [Morella rubra]